MPQEGTRIEVTCKSKFRLTSSAHGVRRYENRLSAEFSAERVTSSPPEFLAEPSGKAERGGEPEGRGGLKKRQFYGIASISPRSCVPSVASGKAERRPPLTPPNLGGEEVTLTSHGVRMK